MEAPSRFTMKHTDELSGLHRSSCGRAGHTDFIRLRELALATDMPSTYEFETGKGTAKTFHLGGGGSCHISKSDASIRRFAYKLTSPLSNANFTDPSRLLKIDFVMQF
jgi:hypothetical protein